MGFTIHINKKFLEELSQLPVNPRSKIERFVFEDVRKYQTISDIPNLRKLKGYKFYYRIRFGNYRAGLSIKDNTLIFERLIHRRDIYRFFP